MESPSPNTINVTHTTHTHTFFYIPDIEHKPKNICSTQISTFYVCSSIVLIHFNSCFFDCLDSLDIAQKRYEYGSRIAMKTNFQNAQIRTLNSVYHSLCACSKAAEMNQIERESEKWERQREARRHEKREEKTSE